MQTLAVADAGFRGQGVVGLRQPQSWDQKRVIIWHENERNWTEMGEHVLVHTLLQCRATITGTSKSK